MGVYRKNFLQKIKVPKLTHSNVNIFKAYNAFSKANASFQRINRFV